MIPAWGAAGRGFLVPFRALLLATRNRITLGDYGSFSSETFSKQISFSRGCALVFPFSFIRLLFEAPLDLLNPRLSYFWLSVPPNGLPWV